METITVAAAIIQYGGRYLLMKRAPHIGNGGLWEFPGGKINPGESLQQTIEREIKEELGVQATAGKVLGSSETIDQDRTLRLFGLETIIESEPQTLSDHSEFLWVKPEDLSKYPMTQAEYGLLNQLKNFWTEEKEIKSVNIWSVAKIAAVIFGVVGIFMGAFSIVTSTLIPMPLGSTSRIFLALFFPILNIAFGICYGAVLGFAYNLCASLFGGIKIRER